MSGLDVTPDVASEPDSDRVAALTGQPRSWVDDMLIDRRGEHHDSNMTAIGLHRVAKHDETYLVSAKRGLVTVEDRADVRDLESLVQAARHDAAPPHSVVAASWTDVAVQEDSENVLGDSALFEVEGDVTEIGIPLLDATSEGLGYYGAVLVEDGTVVRFPEPDYPIWKMELGQTYIDGLVMTDQGTGFYLEWHRDRPHWHQPLTPDAGGYYILARGGGPASVSAHRYELTAFSIPFGAAVYTGLGAIHCDAPLIGQNWLVGYSDSGDFSTALVRNSRGERVRLSGVER